MRINKVPVVLRCWSPLQIVISFPNQEWNPGQTTRLEMLFSFMSVNKLPTSFLLVIDLLCDLYCSILK